MGIKRGGSEKGVGSGTEGAAGQVINIDVQVDTITDGNWQEKQNRKLQGMRVAVVGRYLQGRKELLS